MNTAIVFFALFGCGSGDEQVDLQKKFAIPIGGDVVCSEGTELKTKKQGDESEVYCEANGFINGTYERRYADGTVKIRGEYEDNQRHGNWRWLTPDGKKLQTGRYEHGKEVGGWTLWHPNGNASEQGQYLMGRKAGRWETFYETGNLQSEGLFHNGVKNGDWVYYEDNTDRVELKREKWKAGQLAE